jgi:hypothetical protein
LWNSTIAVEERIVEMTDDISMKDYSYQHSFFYPPLALTAYFLGPNDLCRLQHDHAVYEESLPLNSNSNLIEH